MLLPTESDRKAAAIRRSVFIDALPPELLRREGELPARIALLNAAPGAKLRQVYKLVDEISTIRTPFVACSKGCSSCCHMNVTITVEEATLLSKAAGRKMTKLAAIKSHAPTEFSGQACPFLDPKGLCSVYTDRPLACRLHASYFETSAPCHPTVMNLVEAPKVGFSGPEEALLGIKGSAETVFADIRDFFPSEGK